MSKISFILLSLVILTSCITKERCAKFHPPQISKTDSVKIVISEMVHDTVINIQADSSSLKALLECNEKGEVILRRLLDYQAGQTAGIPQVKISGNILSANCKCDSAKIHAVLKDRETKVYKRNETVITPP